MSIFFSEYYYHYRLSWSRTNKLGKNKFNHSFSCLFRQMAVCKENSDDYGDGFGRHKWSACPSSSLSAMHNSFIDNNLNFKTPFTFTHPVREILHAKLKFARDINITVWKRRHSKINIEIWHRDLMWMKKMNEWKKRRKIHVIWWTQ